MSEIETPPRANWTITIRWKGKETRYLVPAVSRESAILQCGVIWHNEIFERGEFVSCEPAQ